MSLDLIINETREPRDAFAAVTGRVQYVERGAEKPFAAYTYEPGGASRTNGDFAPCSITVRNAWRIAPALSLDMQGFELARRRSAVRDYEDEAELIQTGRSEAAALVQHATGAARVIVFDHTVRRRIPEAPRQPSVRVHVDYTEHSAPARVRALLGVEAEALLARRFAFLNVWRPIRHVAADRPLVLCDARSVAGADLVAQDVIYPERCGEIYAVTANPAHRWYYFPQMRTDEALLFKNYDSRMDVARFTPHTSFQDPTTPAHAPPRESVEYRAIAFY